MRKTLTFCVLLLFICSVSAEESYIKRYNGYPQGTFKKNRNGAIVQYDKNGKKVGVYKIQTRKYVRTK